MVDERTSYANAKQGRRQQRSLDIIQAKSRKVNINKRTEVKH